jgi:hypothetical protein
MAEPERRPVDEPGLSWLEENPGAFLRGFHPARCRWCGATLNVGAVYTLCVYCDVPGGPAIEGGPLE